MSDSKQLQINVELDKQSCIKQNMVLKILSCFMLLTGLVFIDVQAEDTLPSIMQRMQTSTAGVKIAYQEIRTLELMDQPWLGEGYMYSLSPDLMIKQQINPQPLLMAVKANKMFYFDPGNNIRHQGEIEAKSPLTLNIAVFKALMNADTALLNQIYQVQLGITEKRWLITLTPKQDVESGFNIVISGLAERQADTIVVNQADGDISEFTLDNNQADADIKNTILELYRQLTEE